MINKDNFYENVTFKSSIKNQLNKYNFKSKKAFYEFNNEEYTKYKLKASKLQHKLELLKKKEEIKDV